MRKGFTLVECMIAGMILVLVITAFMRALAVVNRVEHENAQYLEADAIVWDAIMSAFTNDYEKVGVIPSREIRVCGHPAQLFAEFDGTYISAWIVRNEQVVVSNAVMRSEYARRRDRE